MSNDTKTALLCAYTLACARHYSDAESLILSDAELSKTTEAIDLLARIRAEQGDLSEARRLWQEIQAVHPEHEPSRLALKNLGKPRKRTSCKACLALGVPALLIVGFLLGALLLPGRVREKTVLWQKLPTALELNALQEGHGGKVGRVLVASDFFSKPENLRQRAVLTQFLCSALGIEPSDLFIGAGAPGQKPEAIVLKLFPR